MARRSSWQLTWLALFGTLLACSSKTAGDSGARDSGAGYLSGGPFVPASIPANVCAMLSPTDIGALVSAPGTGVISDDLTNEYGWMRGCSWPGGVGSAQLTIVGVTSVDAFSSLIGYPGGDDSVQVANLGEGAAYTEIPTALYDGLEAVWHSYDIILSTSGVIRSGTQDDFVPPVRKVIAQLK